MEVTTMNNEMNFEAVECVETVEEVTTTSNKIGTKVALGVALTGLATGLTVGIIKFRHKLANVRDKRDANRLKKRGWTVAEPIPDLDCKDCDESK